MTTTDILISAIFSKPVIGIKIYKHVFRNDLSALSWAGEFFQQNPRTTEGQDDRVSSVKTTTGHSMVGHVGLL